jgi:hypothetical protein
MSLKIVFLMSPVRTSDFAVLRGFTSQWITQSVWYYVYFYLHRCPTNTTSHFNFTTTTQLWGPQVSDAMLCIILQDQSDQTSKQISLVSKCTSQLHMLLFSIF